MGHISVVCDHKAPFILEVAYYWQITKKETKIGMPFFISNNVF